MAAQNGTLTLLDANTGETVTVDIYLPDAAGTQWTFNPTGAAASTSPSTFRVLSDCYIHDVSLAASPTATGSVFSKNSATMYGTAIRHANQLNSLSNRQKLKVRVAAGDIISALSFA